MRTALKPMLARLAAASAAALALGGLLLATSSGAVTAVVSTRARILAPIRISKGQAVRNALEFLRAAGLPPSPAALNIYLKDVFAPQQVWDITWGGEYFFDIDATTGECVLFEHEQKVWLQFHHRGRTGKWVFHSNGDVVPYLWRLARALGVPADYQMEHSFLSPGHGRQSGGDNLAGHASARFSDRPRGYPFLDHPNYMSLVVDAQDGVLTQFMRRDNTVPVTWTNRIGRFAAEAAAHQQYNRLLENDRSVQSENNWYRGNLPHGVSAAVQLGYVVPNRAFGATAHLSNAYPYQARLAWRIPEGSVVLWIDAGDGSLLGGEEYK